MLLLSALLLPGRVPGAQAANVPAGEYFGLVGTGSSATIGSVRIVLTQTGHGTGTVRLGLSSPCALVVGGVGQGGNLLPGHIGDPDMSINLTLTQPPAGPVISGTVSDKDVSFPVTLTRVIPAASVSTLAGKYTFVVTNKAPSELVDQPLAGVAIAQVSKKGGVRLIGALADVSIISAASTLNDAGTLQWFGRSPGKGTLISGTIDFATNNATPGGTGHWVSGSASAELIISGSRYEPSAGFGDATKWQLMVQSSVDPSATVTVDNLLAHGGLLPRLQAGGAAPVQMLLSGANGFAAGRYSTEANGVKASHTLLGVAFQHNASVLGVLVAGSSVKGQFQITPSLLGTAKNEALEYGGSAADFSFPVTGGQVSGGTLTLNAGNTYTGTGVVTTTVGVSKLGDGTLTLNGGITSPGNAVLILNGGGTLSLGSSSTFVPPASGTLLIGSGAVAGTLAGTATVVAPPTFSGAITFNPGGTLQAVGGYLNVTGNPVLGGSPTGIIATGGATLTGVTTFNSTVLTVTPIGAGGVPNQALLGHPISLQGGTQLNLGTLPAGWTATLHGAPVQPGISQIPAGAPSVLEFQAVDPASTP